MNDMMKVIEPSSKQINADDLLSGDKVINITAVTVSPGSEQPVAISFEGSDKTYHPCKSMSRVLVAAWGPDTSKYIGRSIKLYRDPDVMWGGLKVGGIRIREMTDLDGNRPITLALTEKRGSRKPAVIKPLTVESAPAKPDAKAPIHQDNARNAASDGTAYFREWWASEAGKTARPFLGGIMADLKRISEEADAAAKAGGDDPFGLPPLPEGGPSPDEIAARMAEAEAAARESSREAEDE